jgi:MATE family multidrug resistance protein
MTPRQETRELMRLSAPLVAGFVGTNLMSFVDTALVGRLGPTAMAGVGIGSGIFFTLTILATGCALGADPLISQAIGAGERGRARRVYWQALRVAGIVALPVMVGILLTPLVMVPLGVDPEITAHTRAYLWGRVWNAVPLALFSAARSYLQATGATRAIVIQTVVANVTNFVAVALLVYGDEALGWVGLPGVGLPVLGVFGAGLGSSLTAAASLLILFSAVRAVDAPPDPDRRRRDPAIMRRIVSVGLPVGLQLFIEISVFAGASMMSGIIGPVAAAGNQVALALASLTFMVPLGVSAATAVRVGHAVGRRDQPGVRLAGLLGIGVGVGFMVVSALAFVFVPDALARILTNKPEVVAAAVPLVRIAAVFQLFDGLQVVGAGALRGLGETRASLWANLLGHFAIGLPLAVLLAFVAGMEGRGLWWGLTAGLTTVGLLNVVRFVQLARRPVARV